MEETHFILAFSTGLMGSGHCIGMCGGLIAALSLSVSGQKDGLVFHLLYHLGRLATYTLIGFIVGWIGSAIAYTDHFRLVSRVVLIGSDLFIILVGFGTAGAMRYLNVMHLELPATTPILIRITRTIHSLPPWLAALPLGLVMGFIPCGFLYAVAITAAQTASAVKAASVMLGFGLGTIPALMLFGSATTWISDKGRNWMLKVAGLLVAGMGMINLVNHIRFLS